MSRVPHVSRMVLRLVAPREDRDYLLADMAEEHELRSQRYGVAAANRWYRREAIASLAPLLRERYRVRRNSLTPAPAPARAAILDGLLGDLRFTGRLALRKPLLTSMVVLAIALGIGMTTAVVSVIQGVLLDPVPYPGSDRIVMVRHAGPEFPEAWTSVAFPDFLDWREQATTFETIAAFSGRQAAFVSGGEPELMNVLLVTEGFDRVLGVAPALGRFFVGSDFAAGNARVVVLTDELWRTRFGGDASIVGSTVMLDAEPFTVVGILPPLAMPWPPQARMWAPLLVSPDTWMANRESTWLDVVGRIRADVAPEHAKAELDAVAVRLREAYPETNDERVAVRFVPLQQLIVGDVRPMLLLLLSAVAAVLLIACTNVAGVLLARTHERRQELAVRAALGCDGRRLGRQMLTESLALSITGGALGVAMAPLLLESLLALYPGGLPRATEVAIDMRVLSVAVVLVTLTGIVFGIPPARRALRGRFDEAVRTGRRASDDRAHQRARSALVAAQVAFSVVLLVGGSILMRSFLNITRTDPGFRSEGVLTFRVDLARERHPTAEHATVFFRQLEERLGALPGVRFAGSVNYLPFTREMWRSSVRLLGAEQRSLADEPQVDVRLISRGYLDAMGIEILRGRQFDDRERPDGPRVAMVNRALARVLLGNDDIVGRTIEWGSLPVQVIGLIEDVHHYSLDEGDRYEILFAAAQDSRRSRMVAMRVDGDADPERLLPLIREHARALDPMAPISDIATMTQRLFASVAPQRFRALLAGSLALIAFLLAVMGIYAVVANAVGRRTREIGIRLALGERPRNVVANVVMSAVKVAAIGTLIGVPAAFVASRWLVSFVFGVKAHDPATLIAVPLVLLAAAAAASLIPALRASRTEPLRAIASE